MSTRRPTGGKGGRPFQPLEPGISGPRVPLAHDHEEKDPKTFKIERDLPGRQQPEGTVLTVERPTG